MATTWGDIKLELRDNFRDTSQSFVNDTMLLRSARRVIRMITSNYTYAFQEQRGTINLNGSGSYNLRALFPDYKSLYKITNRPAGSTSDIPLDYYSPDDFMDARDTMGYTIENVATLRLYVPTGGTPLSGQLTMLYYSMYMCTTAAGTPIPLPTQDSDLFLIPEHFLDVLTEGMTMFSFRRDRTNREDFTDAKEMFTARLKVMQEEEPGKVAKARSFAGGAF